MSDIESSGRENKRNPILVLAGAGLLGVALALLLFGGSLFNRGQALNAVGDGSYQGQPSLLTQVPEFEQVQPETVKLPSSNSLPKVGEKAHDFTLSGLDGNIVTLSELREQPVIVNFWATWCAPCRIEMPELQAAFEKHQDQGLVILALDQDEPPDVVQKFFFDEMGLTFTPLLDEEGIISQLYGVFNFPATFFINGEGVITAIHHGPMTQAQIEGYLSDTVFPQG
jgi:peroxiredoxin